MIRAFAVAFLIVVLFACAPQDEPNIATVPSGPWDEWAEHNPNWVEPIPPYQIMDNLYYVGSKGLGAYLVAGEKSHILIDGGLPQNGPMIVDSIQQLGFDIEDVGLLLNSHAHFDHSGGLSYLKAVSGAQLYASEADTPWLENGFYPGAKDKPEYSAPSVEVDMSFKNRAAISLGRVQLRAHLTPGHSPGCTSYTLRLKHDGETYQALIFGSATVAGNRLVPEQYPGIISDFEKTFETIKDWKPDIVVSNHPDYFFEQEEKMNRKINGDDLAFVDPSLFHFQIKGLEEQFKARLNAERNEVKQ